jgi:hypothetical protein
MINDLAHAIQIKLQAGPAANVKRGTEAAVTAAFDDAGLRVRWEPVPGDRSLEPEAPRAAEASLHVLLVSDSAESGADMLGAVSRPLGQALAGIRQRMPGLPLGLMTTARSGTQRFAFGRTDTPREIARAMDSIVSSARTGTAVLGWDSHQGAWCDLDDPQVRPASHADRRGRAAMACRRLACRARGGALEGAGASGADRAPWPCLRRARPDAPTARLNRTVR